MKFQNSFKNLCAKSLLVIQTDSWEICCFLCSLKLPKRKNMAKLNDRKILWKYGHILGQINNCIYRTLHFCVPDDLASSIMAARPPLPLTLGQQQVAGLARAATLEQLREKLETSGGEGPERKMARLAEEQQRLMQQAFQHNLLAMASQMPMNLRLGAPTITTRGQSCQSWLCCKNLEVFQIKWFLCWKRNLSKLYFKRVTTSISSLTTSQHSKNSFVNQHVSTKVNDPLLVYKSKMHNI